MYVMLRGCRDLLDCAWDMHAHIYMDTSVQGFTGCHAYTGMLCPDIIKDVMSCHSDALS